jgi:hypothetical protein
MGFQFLLVERQGNCRGYGNDEENGLFVTMQKFKNSDYARREVLKDEFKA